MKIYSFAGCNLDRLSNGRLQTEHHITKNRDAFALDILGLLAFEKLATQTKE